MSKAIYEELLEAGAPPLPDGLGYKVERVSNSVKVAVVERGKRADYELAHRFVLLKSYTLTPEGFVGSRYEPPRALIQLVAEAGRQAYQEVAQKEIEKARLAGVSAEIERLEGTHP